MDEVIIPSTGKIKLPSFWSLLKESWSFYAKYWQKFLMFLIWPLLFVFSGRLFFSLLSIFLLWLNGENQTIWFVALTIIGIVLSLVFSLFLIFVSVNAYIAQLMFINDPSQEVSLANLKNFWLNQTRPYFFKVFFASLIYGLLALLGLLLLIVPGIVFIIFYGFVVFEIVLNQADIENSFNKSRNLVKNYWWPLFGKITLFFVLFLIIGTLIGSLVAGIVFLLNLLPMITISSDSAEVFLDLLFDFLNLIITPISLIFTYFIYDNLKKIKNQ